MAAGDLVVSNFQIEVRTTLMGYGSNFPIDHDRASAYTPLGTPSYKTRDVVLDLGDGSYAPADRLGPLMFTFPLYFQGTSANAALAIQTMRTVWAPASADIQLFHQIPGVGKFYVWGRPRGLSEDARNLEFGTMRWLATFVALTPTYTEV